MDCHPCDSLRDVDVGFAYSIYFKLAPMLMGLKMRSYAHFEHVLAVALLGSLFTVAYPRRLLFVCCVAAP